MERRQRVGLDFGRQFFEETNTDGSGYTMLKSFSTSGGAGADLEPGLVLSGSTLYGMTLSGGSGDGDTIFR